MPPLTQKNHAAPFTHARLGPCILFCPVKMMKEAKSVVPVGKCLPLNKAAVLHSASEASVAAGKAVTVLTYLHGVKEAQLVLEAIQAEVRAARPRPLTHHPSFALPCTRAHTRPPHPWHAPRPGRPAPAGLRH